MLVTMLIVTFQQQFGMDDDAGKYGILKQIMMIMYLLRAGSKVILSRVGRYVSRCMRQVDLSKRDNVIKYESLMSMSI